MQLTLFLPAGSCTWIFCPSDTQKTSPYFPNHTLIIIIVIKKIRYFRDNIDKSTKTFYMKYQVNYFLNL